MADDLSSQYEARLQRNIQKALSKIQQEFYKSVHTITLKFSSITIEGKVFELKKYPSLKNAIEREIKRMHAFVYSTVVNSIEESWDLSNEKNDLIVDKRLAGAIPAKKAKQILYDPNLDALNEFLKRQEKGLNLSKRVWNAFEPFPAFIEQSLAVGISEGKPATEMARDIKGYLNDPDKLFRRVRDAKGNLKLSKAAKAFHPGQGVYRSSYQNALRLTATETNISYRSADYERWQKLSFVIGIEIKLSNSHEFRKVKGKKVCEICECLTGKYSKDFLFTGWHPRCKCYEIPILLSDKDYDKFEDEILGIGKFDMDKAKGVIEDVPAGFKKFMKDNRDKIKGWESKPYWIADNPQFVSL
jgi:hypothetical protein